MRVLFAACFGTLILVACKNEIGTPFPNYNSFIDTTVTVYGPYAAIKLPLSKGVKISNPIQLSMGPNQQLFAANQSGEVYSFHDSDYDGLEDSTALYCNVRNYGLRSPAGFAHKGDTVYIGTAEQIRAFLDTDGDGKADKSWVFFDQIPESGHPYEWTSALTFGPDGWLYCALTTDSWNAAPSADPNGYRGTILRISPDASVAEPVATGIRSVYGMSFNQAGDLFFTDNQGGGNPKEELNLLVPNGFYGHNPAKYPHDSMISPIYELHTEVAPSGIGFNSDITVLGFAKDQLFVAYYGPGERWNRGAVASIEVMPMENGQYEYEETPIADVPKVSDLEFGPDGSLYLAQHGMSDYWYNVVYDNQGAFYKLVHDSNVKNYSSTRELPSVKLSENSVEAGKQLYAERACLGCHQVDGTTELLGPNLKDIGKQYSRGELLEEIQNPSLRIKPSMMAQQITKKDGQVFLGRVVSANDNALSVMLVGNSVVQVNREDIDDITEVKESLMYEGLLTGLSDSEVASLLDYIFSLSR